MGNGTTAQGPNGTPQPVGSSGETASTTPTDPSVSAIWNWVTGWVSLPSGSLASGTQSQIPESLPHIHGARQALPASTRVIIVRRKSSPLSIAQERRLKLDRKKIAALIRKEIARLNERLQDVRKAPKTRPTTLILELDHWKDQEIVDVLKTVSSTVMTAPLRGLTSLHWLAKEGIVAGVELFTGKEEFNAEFIFGKIMDVSTSVLFDKLVGEKVEDLWGEAAAKDADKLKSMTVDKGLDWLKDHLTEGLKTKIDNGTIEAWDLGESTNIFTEVKMTGVAFWNKDTNFVYVAFTADRSEEGVVNLKERGLDRGRYASFKEQYSKDMTHGVMTFGFQVAEINGELKAVDPVSPKVSAWSVSQK